ncbi:Hypothetical protein CINCED_3A014982 [Cinara cedri]|nr:Hypothetical protein CINCED_3A014982 [Cinara cedri]
MILDMALGSKAPASFQNRCRITAALLLVVCVTLTKSAPTTYDEIEAKRTDLVDYFNDPNGCYYNYQHYEEGDRIVTNEPCLNCTCHNRMLMCYLRVCPFSKAIGQDCTVQKSPDQCCPVISCPEVPVHLLTSSTTQKPTTTTEIGWHDNYGCMMNENGFFPDGAQVPSDPKKPCELCYCIRNRTACVMQECTLHVEGCRPVYQEGVCCPVRYDCDYESEKSTTSAPQISGGLVFSTTSAPFDCRVNDEVYNDGESISMVSEKPCEHCYCMRGDIVCAVQDCGEPLRGKDCTPETPPAGQCCPTSYQCANETINSDDITTLLPASQSDSDENEAEKFNSNNDVYDKLGEHQPSQDHDIHDLYVDNVYTTASYNNEIPSDETSDQTTHSSVIDNHKLAGDLTTVPESNSVNTVNEEKQQENPNVIHDLTNHENPTSTETDHTIYESTNKPVESPSTDKVQPIQSPTNDYSVNTVSPNAETTLDENTNVNINEENNNSENDSQFPSQDNLESNSPTVSTEMSTESGTQSSNIQDKPENNSEQQTIMPFEVEIEPTKSSNEVQTTQKEQIDIKPQNGITSNENKNPQKQNSEENNEGSTESVNDQTIVSLNEYEQTTQKLIQNDIDKTLLEESNLQTGSIPNKEQENSYQGIQDITQTPQQINSQTESSLAEGQNELNDNRPQENVSTEQNKLPVENQPQIDDQPESESTSTEQNQDIPQSEIVSPTEPPKVENESTEQNKPQLENKPQAENQPESENTPSIPNQDSLQSENVTPTEFPKVDNVPIEQNKLQVENNPHAEDTAVFQKPSTEENQYSQEVINVLPTEIPSKPNESQSENILSENVQKKPAVPENDLSTEQPDEDNNIFVVSPTSSPLFSQNQVKGEESTSTFNINDTNDKYSSTEKNENKVIEIPQTLAEDKISSTGESNKLPPLSSTETAQENNNAAPQVNDNNTEHSTEAKPIENEANNDASSGVTSSPVSFNNQISGSDEHNDNRFGQNNPQNSEPALAPTTETNDDVNSGLINHGVLVDDPTSQDNQPDSVDEENQGVSDTDLVELQNGPQTVNTVGLELSTNPPSVYETINDITTSLPQQQSADNIVQTKPEETNPVEPIEQTHDEPVPIDLSENSSTESPDNHNVPTAIGEIHNVDEIPKPTEVPVFDTNNGGQYVPTQIPEQNNEYENSTPHEQSQDENINKIVEQSSINTEHSPDNNNNLNTATGSNLNNEEYITPPSDKIELGTNAPQEFGEEPTQNTNENISVENESTTYSQAAQINQGNSEKVENVNNLATTNSYADISLIVSTTNSPINQYNENKESSPLNPSNNIKINVDNYQSVTVIPQQNADFDETSTQYSIDDSNTSNIIQESPNVNGNNIPNGVNHDQITELYATQSSTEKNTHTADSNKIPITDATTTDIPNLPEQNNSVEINANEIADEKSTETPYDTDNPLVTNTPNYVIDITTMNPSESPNNVPVPIKTEDQVNSINEVTTSNIDQNNDATTELYENVQPGVPGEGSCLINFITYAHKAEVPKSNPCHEKCECLNSIVTCTSVNCPPAPPTHKNCIPLHPGNESWCCPTYLCEGGIEGMIFENHDKLGGTPQLISSVLLEDKPDEENYDKTPSGEIQSTTNPQIALEYNTETPVQFDLNSNTNSQDATDVPVQYEIPDKQIDDFITTTHTPVTTASIEPIDHKKPIGIENPVISDQLTENIQSSGNEKPVDNDQSSENDKSSENEKPTENYQSSENGKPTHNSEVDISTVTYVFDVQTTTNKLEASNNFAEQTTLSNAVNESPDYSVPSTDKPNYESTLANIPPANDQIQPEHNSELDDSITATTYAPKDSVVDNQENEQLKDGVSKPTSNEESNLKPISDITDLPVVEVTQTSTIVSDEKPTNNESNVNGLRPTSIDDIISSVNLVKDAIKNSLETSSKPAEIDYQTTVGVIENDHPTTVTGESGSPLLDDSLPNKYNEPLTTENSVNVVPELQTDVSNEKLPENLTPIESSDELGGTTKSPNVLPSANADQEVSTDLLLNALDKQEISSNPSVSNSNVNKPEEILDDKTSEVTTVQYVLSSTEQESASNVPETSSDSNVLQVNVESSTSVPGIVANDRISDMTTQTLQSEAQQQVHVDNLPINKPVEAETPVDAESPVLPNADSSTDNIQPVEVVTQTVNGQLPTDNSVASHDSDDNNKYVGEPNSSPTPSEPSVVHEDNKRPQEGTGDMVQIPFDTEKPSLKPFSSTPFTPTYSQKPPYTPIPQSTWTPKPFHQDSTSEAPQPDQGFPDEYDDENEAVFGPGTCRYGGKIYVSAQQVPRDDPCDFCFCFRGDIICLQQSCPPPIFGCYQENIQGFCCPRYECPVAQTTSVNVTTTTTTTTTAVPPHFFAGAYRGAAKRTGCLIHGHAYKVGEDVGIASGPCLECTCRADGKMKCDPKPCSPEPLLRKMMAEAVDQRKR